MATIRAGGDRQAVCVARAGRILPADDYARMAARLNGTARAVDDFGMMIGAMGLAIVVSRDPQGRGEAGPPNALAPQCTTRSR